MGQCLAFIVQSSKTQLKLLPGSAALALQSREAKDTTPTWLAYEAYRAKLYQEYASQHTGRLGVPKSVYSGDKAWDLMYECLEKVGGSFEEKQHLDEFIRQEQEREKIER